MLRIAIVVVGLCVAIAARADSVPPPTPQPTDTWTFRRTTETLPAVWRQIHFQGTVLRNSGTTMVIRNNEVDSPNPPREILINSDWSSFRSLGGRETVVHHPFEFPLSVGKTWELAYTDDHPANKNHKSETRHLKYRVVGWEDVDVPAGKFKALKIEADGACTRRIGTHPTSSARSRAWRRTTTPTVFAAPALPMSWSPTRLPNETLQPKPRRPRARFGAHRDAPYDET